MKDTQAAIVFNDNMLASGQLTKAHVAWLVDFFQRANGLTTDGKAGTMQTLPALKRYIRIQTPEVSYQARGTGYYPDDSPMEGGFKDRLSRPLRTLQGFLAGTAEYVSCAMDTNAFPYGQRLRIPELEQKYGKEIDFRVVDTGSAFKNKGTTRIDICTASKQDSLDKTINGPLTLIAVDA